MSDTNNETPNTEAPKIETPVQPLSAKPSVWPRRLLLGGVVLGGLVTAGAVAAVAGGMKGEDGHGWGRGWGHHGWDRGGHGGGPDGGPGPERGLRMIGKALNFVDATPEQEKKIREIVETAFKDFGSMRQEMRGTRDEALNLFRAATVDRAAVEKLRVERLARMDDMSKKMANAAVEIAETLTPEQRVKLADEIDNMKSRWRGPFEK
jgi:protein CpxP